MTVRCVADRTPEQDKKRWSLRANGAARPAGAQPNASLPGALLSGLLIVILVTASLLALYEVRKLSLASSYLARSASSTQTVRSFYAGLNEYMETGDISAVSDMLAPDALIAVPSQGAMGDDSGLLTYLVALRSTLPELRFTIEKIETEGEIAIATVRRTGIEEAPASSLGSASGLSQEFFRISGGRIVQQWTTEPDTVLTYTLTDAPMRAHLIRTGNLAIAELTFAPARGEAHPVDGPALLLVERGSLTLIGDGQSQILDSVTGVVTAPALNQRVAAEPGQAIAVLSRRAQVQNDGPDAAVARIATLVEDAQHTLESFAADRHRPEQALNHISTMRSARTAIIGSVTVLPLVFDNRSIPAGIWEVEISWAVLGPGTALPPSALGDRTLVHRLTDSVAGATAYQNAGDLPDAQWNDTGEPVSVLLIRVDQIDE